MSNLSRLKRSQVKQQLWFAYDDLDKLPTVIENIKTEIGASCPSLITDGSRPFRVIWSDYRDDHLEVSVDCRFRHPVSVVVHFFVVNLCTHSQRYSHSRTPSHPRMNISTRDRMSYSPYPGLQRRLAWSFQFPTYESRRAKRNRRAVIYNNNMV